MTDCEKTGMNNQKGVALLMTITVLFVIFALVSEVNRNVRASVEKTHMSMERARLSELATSGINIGIALLMEDKRTTDVDTIQENWADPVKIDELLADFPFSDGTVKLAIVDELGKIQMNALVAYPEGKEFNPAQKLLWESFLKMLNPPDESIDSLGENGDIINCIKDWLDSGDDDASTGINGVESEYYEALNPPYKAANGPFRALDELVLVKGITRAMVDRVEMGYRLSDLMTVYGMAQTEKKSDDTEKKTLFTYPGKVNINTADLPVIMALMPDSKSDLENSIAAQAIYDFRGERTEDGFVNALSGQWYLNCPGCEDSGIRKDLITTTSDVFSIICTAATTETQRTITAVVRRDDKKGKYTVLSWKAE
ncbi:MAG: general secretion pathway protein GspK [Proteobacteria bacterium]|nr:general secretion pathway protein GspK [Pseudomonadota bacterium]